MKRLILFVMAMVLVAGLAMTGRSSAQAADCGGHPCTAEPPVAFVAGDGGEIQAAQGSYCWSNPTIGGGHCADVFGRSPWELPALSVSRGETLTVRFETEAAPTAVYVREDQSESRTLTPANPVAYTVDLPPGIHVLSFLTYWYQGDAAYRVALRVRPETVAEESSSLFTALHSGKAMDVPGSTHDSGAQIIQWSPHGDTNQQWRLVPFGAGTYIYVIASEESGLVLDVEGASMANGAHVVQTSWQGNISQLWVALSFADIVPGGDPNTYVIVSAMSGKVLDVAGASMADGAGIIQWPWWGGWNQIWLRVTEVEA